MEKFYHRGHREGAENRGENLKNANTEYRTMISERLSLEIYSFDEKKFTQRPLDLNNEQGTPINE